jgi:hypothetical protein
MYGQITAYFNDAYAHHNYSFVGSLDMQWPAGTNSTTIDVFGGLYEKGGKNFTGNVSLGVQVGTPAEDEVFQSTQFQIGLYNNYSLALEYDFKLAAAPSQSQVTFALSSSCVQVREYAYGSRSVDNIWQQGLTVFAQDRPNNVFYLLVQPQLMSLNLFDYSGKLEFVSRPNQNNFAIAYSSFGFPQELVQEGDLKAQWALVNASVSEITFNLTSALQVNSQPFWAVNLDFFSEYYGQDYDIGQLNAQV